MENLNIINEEGLFPDEPKDLYKTHQDWIDTYFRLRKIDPTFTRKELKIYNQSFFEKSTTSSALNNLHRNYKISFDNIRTIVIAVRQYLIDQNKTTINPEVIRNRQRLVQA